LSAPRRWRGGQGERTTKAATQPDDAVDIGTVFIVFALDLWKKLYS
jgi:hypothetical protein